MARNPTIEFDTLPNAASINAAYKQVQNSFAKRPIKLNIAVDGKGLNEYSKGLGKLSGRAAT